MANMNSRDALKLSAAVVGAIAGSILTAMNASGVYTWSSALSPASILGSIVTVCALIPAWLANTPGNGKGPQGGEQAPPQGGR